MALVGTAGDPRRQTTARTGNQAQVALHENPAARLGKTTGVATRLAIGERRHGQKYRQQHGRPARIEKPEKLERLEKIGKIRQQGSEMARGRPETARKRRPGASHRWSASSAN